MPRARPSAWNSSPIVMSRSSPQSLRRRRSLPSVGTIAEAEPYVSKTANLRRRLQRLLSAPTEHSKRLNLRDRVRCIEYTPTGSDFESGFLLYRASPHGISQDLRRPAAPALCAAGQAAPGKRISARVHHHPPGPAERPLSLLRPVSFPRRGGEVRQRLARLLQDAPLRGRPASRPSLPRLHLFRDEDVPRALLQRLHRRRVPWRSGPRAGLFRQRRPIAGAGDFGAQRDQASAALEFENAAALHAKLEKLKPVARPSAGGCAPHRPAQRAVMVQPCAVPECGRILSLERGRITGPLTFPIQSRGAHQVAIHGSAHADSPGRLPAENPKTALETMEHLALLKRWCYRSTSDGRDFLCDEKGGLPMRRLVRGISRVYRGEKPETLVPDLEDRVTGPY